MRRISLSALLRLGLVVQLALGAGLTAWLLPDGLHPLWRALALPAGAAALPVLGTAIVLAVELIVGALLDGRPQRTSLWSVVKVWLGEIAVSLRMFCWEQPFNAGFAEAPLMHDPQRPAVLLIHGYVCNRAVWKPFLESGLLDGCNTATLNLAPVFCKIEEYADVVHKAVGELRAATGAAQVVLVCHSMGGLAARVYLRKHGTGSVKRVVTVATPHQGTVFGHLGHGPNGRQMAAGSSFLKHLALHEDAQIRSRFVCIATRDDNLVVPRSSPLLEGAEQHCLDGVGHLALIADRRTWQLIAKAVEPRQGDMAAAVNPAGAVSAVES